MKTMAQIQKQKVQLTTLLREKLRDLRKTYNKRGDVLSKELDRGASYISQLENGKIRDIEFDLLETLFQHIIGLSGNDYESYISKYVYNIIANAPSKDFLYKEEWIHIFVMQKFQYDIPDQLVQIIDKKLLQLNYSSEQLVEKINQNPFQHYWSDSQREINKLYITIDDKDYDNYSIYTDITYSLPMDYVAKILSKTMTTSTYIYMDGILKILYYIENEDKSGSIKKAKKILFDNSFFDAIEIFENTHKLPHTQQPLNMQATGDQDIFTFYDEVIVNYNQKYNQLKEKALEKLDYAFDRYKEEHTSYACEALEKIIDNMNDDLGLITAMISSPINSLPKDLRQYFWNDYKELLLKYIPNK